jgi:hypothetical protein
MSRAGKKILDAAKELDDFAVGKNAGPMVLWMPDGSGGLTKREVADMDEYRATWKDEGVRAIKIALAEHANTR